MISARFDYAESTALSLIHKHMFNKLAIDPLMIVAKMSHVDAIPYSWLAKQKHLSIDSLSDMLNSESGCCLYNQTTGQYSILYNNSLASPGRIRWTIAHELGHCVLGHLLEYGEKRCDLIHPKLYRILEQEADAFARELLAPACLVQRLGIVIPDFSPLQVSECFGVSLEAAANIVEHLGYLVRNKVPIPDNLIPQFQEDLDRLVLKYLYHRSSQERDQIIQTLRSLGFSANRIRVVLKQYGY